MADVPTASLPKRLLNRDLDADARRILDAHNLPCNLVVSVDRDSILYMNDCGKPRTCWLDAPPDRPLRVRMVPGFAVSEPADWHTARDVNYGLAGTRP